MRAPLVVTISKIPAEEGLPVAGEVTPADVHLEKESDFALEPGARVDLHVDKSDDESLHVRGTVEARLRLQCSRCTTDYVVTVPPSLDLFYLPHQPGDADEESDEVELSDRDMVVSYYQGDRLDLGDALREHFFLDLPMKRLCRDACAGLCVHCGKDLNEGPCACPPDEPEHGDPRFAGLKKLLGGES
jgi:uncharacterized protein